MPTLQQIRDHSPCNQGWTTLLKSLPCHTMDTFVSLGDIAKSNGPQDALWCLRCGQFTKDEIERALRPLVIRADAATRAVACADAARAAARAATRAAAADAAADAAAARADYAADAADAAAARADYAADAADAACAAARDAACAADYAAARAAARAAEEEQQVLDIIAVWPLTSVRS